MFSTIVANEGNFNNLLANSRLQSAASADLISAGCKWSDSVWATAERLGPIRLTGKQLKDGEILAQHPVFICGVHRSGTTLLRDVLDDHPDLVVLPSEGTFYTNQEQKLLTIPQSEWAAHLGKEWLRRLANPVNQPPYWLLGSSDENNSPYVDYARYVMAWWAKLQHKPGTQWPHMAIVLAYATYTNSLSAKYWVDKTPTNERFLGRIWREMPSAKVLHMVREPIAILSSRREMEPSAGLQGTLKFLKRSFSIAAKQNVSQQYMVVRYEDLCNESESKIRQIADFLCIEPLAALNQPSVMGRASQANSSFNSELHKKGIITPDKHRQHSNLTDREQRLIAAVMERLAGIHGYQMQKTSAANKVILTMQYLIGR